MTSLARGSDRRTAARPAHFPTPDVQPASTTHATRAHAVADVWDLQFAQTAYGDLLSCSSDGKLLRNPHFRRCRHPSDASLTRCRHPLDASLACCGHPSDAPLARCGHPFDAPTRASVQCQARCRLRVLPSSGLGRHRESMRLTTLRKCAITPRALSWPWSARSIRCTCQKCMGRSPQHPMRRFSLSSTSVGSAK